jgi:hypothetical protein
MMENLMVFLKEDYCGRRATGADESLMSQHPTPKHTLITKVESLLGICNV